MFGANGLSLFILSGLNPSRNENHKGIIIWNIKKESSVIYNLIGNNII